MKFTSVLKTHRLLGLVCFPFMLLMASTGILLNHTDDLKLSQTELRWNWLMSWYDIKKPNTFLSISEKKHTITQIEQRIYLNSKEILISKQPLIAAKIFDKEIILFLTNHICITTIEGELIEKIKNHHGLPSPIDKCGTIENTQLIIQSNNKLYNCDLDELNFKTYNQSKKITWLKTDVQTSEVSQKLYDNYSGKGISAHKLITDLHNGFFFTSLGKLFLDIIGLLFIFLSCTGLWVYLAKPKVTK